MYTTQVLHITKDGVLYQENIKEIQAFVDREFEIIKEVFCAVGRKECTHLVNEEVIKLVGNESIKALSLKEMKELIIESNDGHTPNPIQETDMILENVSGEKLEQRTQNVSIIVVKSSHIIIGIISVIVDSRITLKDDCCAFFIGINKSVSLHAAQYYLKRLKEVELSWENKELLKIRVSEIIIPALIKHTKEVGAKYTATIPLMNMMKILRKYYGFEKSENIIVLKSGENDKYVPPNSLITIEEEIIAYKKID